MDQLGFARKLRASATEPERLLRKILRRRGLEGHRFRRQRPIGEYVVDFVCLERRVVIELDGGQHQADRAAHDAARTAFLQRAGLRVLRFWNNELVGCPEGVAEAILEACRAARPPQPPRALRLDRPSQH
jgi:very-short-patch-repair endonuclease